MKALDWPLYRYKATVQRVVDGDTIYAEISLGCRVHMVRSIRILGFDSPELFSGDDREAGGLARDALADLLPVGSRVYIETQLDRTSFDRLLGTVYVEGSDGNLHDVAESMIAGGFGVMA